MYVIARAIVFLSITLGGSFAFLAMTTPGNSAPMSLQIETPTGSRTLREIAFIGIGNPIPSMGAH